MRNYKLKVIYMFLLLVHKWFPDPKRPHRPDDSLPQPDWDFEEEEEE